MSDTSTTGQSALKAVEALRKEGAEIVAVAVKHVRKSHVMADLMKRIKAEGYLRKNRNGTTSPGAVNDIRLMTEREATYGVYENAERIMRARRMRIDAEYDRAYEAVQKYHGHFRFGEFLRGCENRAARRTALLLLIDECVLLTETSGRIDDLTILMVRR
jgi:Asp-tRNA(Asn)/Glu-tRNA(Gln) amidotransferase A subunit family amidase